MEMFQVCGRQNNVSVLSVPLLSAVRGHSIHLFGNVLHAPMVEEMHPIFVVMR